MAQRVTIFLLSPSYLEPQFDDYESIEILKWRKKHHCKRESENIQYNKLNKGNAKRGVSPRLKIRPCDLDLWTWKSIGFQILLRTMYVPSVVKIHWRMLILECSQGCYERTEGRKEGRTDGQTVALLYPFATSLARG